MTETLNKNEILVNTADAVLNSGITLRIKKRPKNSVFRVLQQLKLVRGQYTYKLGPLCLGTLVKISKIILGIEVSDMKGGNVFEGMYQAITDNTDKVVEIIGHAIMNSKTDPSAELLELLRLELTADDMSKILTVLINQMDLRSFIHSITLIRGLFVMQTEKVSPEDQRS
jgi:hypothetical protein